MTNHTPPTTPDVHEHQGHQRKLVASGVIPATRVTRIAIEAAIVARERAWGRRVGFAPRVPEVPRSEKLERAISEERVRLKQIWLAACIRLADLQARWDNQQGLS